ncbi:MAG: hypothetical protein Q8P86_01890 [bacterium]|nr:hypothetical protein [bacterium]
MTEVPMMQSDIMVLGLHLDVFLMYAAGVFYALCAFLVLKSYRRERGELLGAFLAFLTYQALAMIFMGIEFHTMNLLYGEIAAVAVFVGSAYMIKFPFSSFSRGTRRIVFLLTLIVSLAIFTWFLLTPERKMLLMPFVLWYDIIVNGLVVGGAIIIFGMRVGPPQRMKALGGGAGVVSCCVVANASMLSGAFITSAFFQFLAPVLIIGSLVFARKRQSVPLSYGTPLP